MSLHVINSINDNLSILIKDDPVRPEISLEQRVSDRSEIFVLLDDLTLQPEAVLCCSYCNQVPNSVDELFSNISNIGTIAVFYTIWSYRAGAGRDLIFTVRQWVTENRSNVTQYVTLSPCTELARRFHLRNGASIFRVNKDTVNYQYS